MLSAGDLAECCLFILVCLVSRLRDNSSRHGRRTTATCCGGSVGVARTDFIGRSPANGDRGGLEINHRPDGSSLRACVGADIETATWQDIVCPPVPTNYQRFAEAVQSGVNGDPSFRHAANIQRILDLANVTEADRQEHKV